MSNDDRLKQLRSKAEMSIRPEVETEKMLIGLLYSTYAPIFEAVSQINETVNGVSADYSANKYFVKTDLPNRFLVQRIHLAKSPSVFRELILTLWPNHGNIVLSSSQGQAASELTAFTSAEIDKAVNSIFDQADSFFSQI